ncbi:MAG: SnoaL-like domain-containing protein [Oscillibacter sp.]|nr:SnoaL-like domain-containing protein [Oscillibacter sp.]
MTNIKKAIALINTFATGDTAAARNLLAKGCIQHNTGIADGVSGLGAALAALAEQGIQMIYTTVHQVLAQGSFVLAVSEGTFGGAPTSYYDLWRVEDGKIAAHWDVMETIAGKSIWANENGKF